MKIRQLWEFVAQPGLLSRLSDGRPRRAALVLIGAHLGALLVLWLLLTLIWLVGLSSIFTTVHWIPAVLGTVVFLVIALAMMMAFGFWGTGATSGMDGGDRVEDHFTPGAAAGLGWLRWLMQLVMIMGAALPMFLIWANMRWYHVAPTPEIKELSSRVATMPFPQDWVQEEGTRTDGPFPAEHFGYEVEHDVPESYRFADLETWMSSPEWKTSFGALQKVRCTAQIEHCTAQVVPAKGAKVTHFLEAWYYDSTIEGLPTTVRMELIYWPDGRK